MAIIGKIRKHSALAVVIVGIAIAAFVIGDFGKGQIRAVTDIGSVNGEEIPYTDFNYKVEENLEIQRENTGLETVTEEVAYNVRQNTWNTMVSSLVTGEEFQKLGLTVSPDELFELVQGQHPHRYILQYFKDPNTGQYDPAIVLNYLRNLDQMEPQAKAQWLQFERAIKEDQFQLKFNNLIARSYYVPKQILHKQYEMQSKSWNIRFISPSYYTIPDSVATLTDKDYRNFYEKNKIYFYNDQPYVDLDFVVFEVKPSAKDRRDIAEDVTTLYADFQTANDPLAFVNANSDKKYDTNFISGDNLPMRLDSLLVNSRIDGFVPPYEENSAWYMAKLLAKAERPDSMQGSQLLVTWAGLGVAENVTRTQTEAKQRADSLLALLRTNPSRFAEVTKETSDYPTAKEDGGLLPWFPDGNPNVSPFFDAGISMRKNEVKIIETRLGYSLFLLSEKSEDRPKIKAAILQRNIEPSSKTFQDYYTQASTYAGRYNNPIAFDTGAISEGINIRHAQQVKEMDYTVTGLKNARNVIRWSFAEQTKVGEVSPVFDLQGVYAVILLKDRYKKGEPPLDQVKERIEPNVRNAKKIEILAGRLEEAMKNQTDIHTLAAAFNTRVDTTTVTFSGMSRSQIARENEVMGNVFVSPPGILAGPFQGNLGVYVVIVDNITDAPAKENYMAEERSDKRAWTNRVSNSLYDALKKQADIVDNRILFY
ncbi:MAG: SurA N-terminal domain-containing protein [Bacteroidetes bacterium]|nr:SurA N-terminal domain-containing protein [Bacteroidota bacterium]